MVLSFVSIHPINSQWDVIFETDCFLVFVGFWPAQSAVVVAHQGTNPLKLYGLRFLVTLRRTLIRHADCLCSPT